MVRLLLPNFIAACFLILPYAVAQLVWIGAVTHNSFRIHLDVPPSTTNILLSTDQTFKTNTSSISNTPATLIDAQSETLQPSIYGNLRRYSFTSLQPLTKYYIATQTATETIPVASIRTFPPPESSADVTFALSACQSKYSRDSSFTDIDAHFRDSDRLNSTFLMLHMGDMTYSDISADNIAPFHSALRKVLLRPRIRNVFSSLPVSYMYDDHDYGENNSGFFSSSRRAAMVNYRAMVPSYELPASDAVYHAFTVGSVRVIMTDLRSLARHEKGSTLGLVQRVWFLRQLETADSYSVVVWMTSKPWIGRDNSNDDTWAAFPEERKIISRRIAELNVTNMIAVAGDAHMLAADDGSYTDYAEQGGGFPIFQAAPLSNFGSSKGGPYSEGVRGYRLFRNRHYGILRLTKLAEEGGPCVQFLGYSAGKRDKPSLQFRRCGRLGGVNGTGGQDDSSDLSTFPTWVAVLIVLAIGWSILLVVGLILLCRICKKRQRICEEGEANKAMEQMQGQGEEGAIRDQNEAPLPNVFPTSVYHG